MYFVILDCEVTFDRASLVGILWLDWECLSPKSSYIGFCPMPQVKARAIFQVYRLAWGFLNHRFSELEPQACLRADLWQSVLRADFFVVFSPKVWAETWLRLNPYRMRLCSWGCGQGCKCGWLTDSEWANRGIFPPLSGILCSITKMAFPSNCGSSLLFCVYCSSAHHLRLTTVYIPAHFICPLVTGTDQMIALLPNFPRVVQGCTL